MHRLGCSRSLMQLEILKVSFTWFLDTIQSLSNNATLIDTIVAQEVINFDQSDLVPDDVMLLDVSHTVFLWIGKESNKDEQKGSVEIAQNYLRTDPSGRDAGTPILMVKQGYEPPTFTGFFGVWDPLMWDVCDYFNVNFRNL